VNKKIVLTEKQKPQKINKQVRVINKNPIVDKVQTPESNKNLSNRKQKAPTKSYIGWCMNFDFCNKYFLTAESGITKHARRLSPSNRKQQSIISSNKSFILKWSSPKKTEAQSKSNKSTRKNYQKWPLSLKDVGLVFSTSTNRAKITATTGINKSCLGGQNRADKGTNVDMTDAEVSSQNSSCIDQSAVTVQGEQVESRNRIHFETARQSITTILEPYVPTEQRRCFDKMTQSITTIFPKYSSDNMKCLEQMNQNDPMQDEEVLHKRSIGFEMTKHDILTVAPTTCPDSTTQDISATSSASSLPD
jgi:hypothetical protein